MVDWSMRLPPWSKAHLSHFALADFADRGVQGFGALFGLLRQETGIFSASGGCAGLQPLKSNPVLEPLLYEAWQS